MKDTLHCVAAATKSILVIDDDAAVLKALSKVLTKENHAVATASSKDEAMDRLRHGGVFDLVISDGAMFDESGGEFVEVIRRISPPVPLILMTDFGCQDAVGNALASGATVILPKPIGSEELLQLLSKIVKS